MRGPTPRHITGLIVTRAHALLGALCPVALQQSGLALKRRPSDQEDDVAVPPPQDRLFVFVVEPGDLRQWHRDAVARGARDTTHCAQRSAAKETKTTYHKFCGKRYLLLVYSVLFYACFALLM